MRKERNSILVGGLKSFINKVDLERYVRNLTGRVI